MEIAETPILPKNPDWNMEIVETPILPKNTDWNMEIAETPILPKNTDWNMEIAETPILPKIRIGTWETERENSVEALEAHLARTQPTQEPSVEEDEVWGKGFANKSGDETDMEDSVIWEKFSSEPENLVVTQNQKIGDKVENFVVTQSQEKIGVSSPDFLTHEIDKSVRFNHPQSHILADEQLSRVKAESISEIHKMTTPEDLDLPRHEKETQNLSKGSHGMSRRSFISSSLEVKNRLRDEYLNNNKSGGSVLVKLILESTEKDSGKRDEGDSKKKLLKEKDVLDD